MVDQRASWWCSRPLVLLATTVLVACGETVFVGELFRFGRCQGKRQPGTVRSHATAAGAGGHLEWVLFLWRGELLYYTYQFDVLDLFRVSMSLPDPGIYDMVSHSDSTRADDEFTGRYVFSFAISYGVFHVESGTLTIDASSDEEISGSFEMTAVLDEANSSDVRADTAMVSGTFRAVPGVIPVVN